MKHLFVLFVSVVTIACSAFAKQEEYIRHKVEKGETVTQLAKRYKVTPFDIYKLNPDTQNGLKENIVVLIPKRSSANEKIVKKKKESKIIETTTHEVAPKETLFGIAKKYNVSVDSIEIINAELLKNGLKKGQTIFIPTSDSKEQEVKSVPKPKSDKLVKEQFIIHEVQLKETKYGIAKKYGITIEDLEILNPEIKDTLPLGFRLRILNKDFSKSDVVVVERVEKTEDAVKKEKQSVADNFIDHEVKLKETLYSLSKSFGISEEDLIVLNPELKNGLKEGMILKVPVSISEKQHLVVKEYKDLTSRINNKEKKELVLLLPFNASKIVVDSLEIGSSRILNMTLDFYSGALMAIDSARNLGLNVNIRIFDSEETKNTSSVAKIISSNNFLNVDAVIGPFYQSNVEKTATLLKKYDIPVISPMSKDIISLYSNLYQSVPTSDFLKLAMLNYLKIKDGNVIAVIDPKKESIKKFIIENYPEVKFASIEANGLVNSDDLKELLSKDKNNYVILETERAGLILDTTNILLSELLNYSIKLVTLEKNNSFEYDEISSTRLMKLNLHYPSITRDLDLPEINSFSNAYKKKNNVYPNQYALRGFDVTFDVLIRLSQKENFADTVDDVATEQIGSRFEYHKKHSKGYSNEGIYILYYNDDLTIKNAN